MTMADFDPPSMTSITTCGTVPKIEECDLIEDVKDPQQQLWGLVDPPSTGITTCGTVPKVEECDQIEDVKDPQQQPWGLVDPPSTGDVPKVEECDLIEDVKDPQQQLWGLLDPPSTGITTCGTVPKIEECDVIEDVKDPQHQLSGLVDPPSTGITTCGTVPKIEECDLIEVVKDPQHQLWGLVDPADQHGEEWTRYEIKVETREDGDTPTPSGIDTVAIETGNDDEGHDFKASSLTREAMDMYLFSSHSGDFHNGDDSGRKTLTTNESEDDKSHVLINANSEEGSPWSREHSYDGSLKCDAQINPEKETQTEYQVKVSLFGKTDVKYKIKVTRSSDSDFHSDVTYEPVREACIRNARTVRRTEVMSTCMHVESILSKLSKCSKC